MGKLVRENKFKAVEYEGKYKIYQRVRYGKERSWVVIEIVDELPENIELTNTAVNSYYKRADISEREREQIKTLLFWGVKPTSVASWYGITHSTACNMRKRICKKAKSMV